MTADSSPTPTREPGRERRAGEQLSKGGGAAHHPVTTEIYAWYQPSVPQFSYWAEDDLRDNHDGMLELVAAYERDSLYFGVVRVCTSSETAAFEFGVHLTGFQALRRILDTRPFGSMPGVKHSFYFHRESQPRRS